MNTIFCGENEHVYDVRVLLPCMRSITRSGGLGTFVYVCLKLLVLIIVLLDLEQVVAVKQLDRNGLQGNREFLVEVLMLSLLHHPNLVNLIGYCADGDQRLLVYEFMPSGSLEDHLHGMVFLHIGSCIILHFQFDKPPPPTLCDLNPNSFSEKNYSLFQLNNSYTVTEVAICSVVCDCCID